MVKFRFIFFFAAFFLICRPGTCEDAPTLYKNHCARCHGDTGRGDGPARVMQRPWPRDFGAGEYKFRSTPLDTLPAVDDIAQTIRQGILRSSMPPFKKIISEADIQALASYVLQMSKGSGLPEGTPFSRPLDLDDASVLSPAAIEAGKAVYEKLQCATCHGVNGKGAGAAAAALRDSNGFWMAPADLTDPDAYGGGSRVSDIYMRLKTGLAASPMPDYSETLDEESARAIALYVKSLQIDPAQRKPVDWAEWKKSFPPATRGEYLVRSMSCALCHNHYNDEGEYNPAMYLAGGVAIRIRGLGTFPTRNLTSHPEDGLGKWTEDEIVQALMRGHAPTRRLEAFAMPWVFFSHLEESDARDIAAYLKTLPPIANRVPERKYDPVWKRLWSRARQLLGLEQGRLEYPPGNAGDAHEKN